MPDLNLDANKIIYTLLTIIVFLGGFIVNGFVNNSKDIAIKQDEISIQLAEIKLNLVEIKKDIITRSEIVELVNDELIKHGLIPYGK